MRYKRNSFLIEGLKNNIEALQAQQKISAIYFSEDAKAEHLNQALELAKASKIALQKIPGAELEKISTLVNPDGMLGIGKIGSQTNKIAELKGQSLYLHRINDPGNLGTILRTAAWFGLDQILLSKGSVDPYNPKVIRAAMGGLFYIDIIRNVNFQELKASGRSKNQKIVAADMTGKNITRLSGIPENFILCMGSESHGLPDEIMSEADQIISIPKLGHGESLNLAISAGIIIKDFMLSS